LADRLCLSLINRRQLSPRDFRKEETGTVLLNDDGRTKVLKAWQERKRDIMTHPFLGEKMPFGLAPQVQASLLASHLRDELDGYPAFIWK
jgi:CRISPR-associated protein Cas1